MDENLNKIENSSNNQPIPPAIDNQPMIAEFAGSKLSVKPIWLVVIIVGMAVAAWMFLKSKSANTIQSQVNQQINNSQSTMNTQVSSSKDLPRKLSEISSANPTTPLEVLAAYYSLLSGGDIEGAAKLSVDPQATINMWTAYRDRVGANAFRSKFDSTAITVSKVMETSDAIIILLKDNYNSYVNVVGKSKDGGYKIVEDPSSLSVETQEDISKILPINN